MPLTITTWNINSVRLRIDGVAKFVKAVRPDVLCLQETKCPDDRFPLKRFKRLGYEHVALNGQKGYHGVVVLSRLPFESFNVQSFCGKADCRHVSAVLGERAGLRDPITLHNLYVPAGGDVPDPAVNPKFAHKLAFLDEMRASAALRCQNSNRMMVPEPTKLYTWWSYRSPDWKTADKGRRLDHIWIAPALADRVIDMRVLKQWRGAARPSDHVPVTATLDV